MRRFGAIGIVVAFLALLAALALPRRDPGDGRGGAKTQSSKTPRGMRWTRGGEARSVHPASGATDRRALAGRVVDALTGEPIGGATVSLRTGEGEEIAAADSADDGSFSFAAVSGPAILAASAPGYAFLTEEIDAGEVVLALDPSVRLSGVVVDPSGAPIAGAEVWAEDSEGDDWERWPRPASDTTTSAADGSFVIEDAPSGRIVVHATHPRFARGEAEVGGVGPGRSREGIRVALVQGGTVAGRILDPEGTTPVADAAVTIFPEGEAGKEARSRADGSFEFTAVRPGEVRITALAGHAEAETVVKIAASQTRQVELRLEAAGVITGTVVDERGTPVEDAQVFASGGGTRKSVYTGDEGRFTLSGLADEEWHLRAHADGYERASVTARAGQEVEIMLSRGTVVFGTVRSASGKIPAEAEVLAVEDLDRSRSKQVVEVAADGTWRFAGLAPGVWKIRASGTGYSPSAPVEVTIDTSIDRGPIELVVTAGGRVRGRVAGPDGSPVPGARVSLSRRGRSWMEGEERAQLDWSGVVRTDPQGRFELASEAGDVAIFVYHPEMHAEVVRLTVPADGHADAGTIYLREGQGASAIFEFSGIGCVIRYDEGRLEVGGVLPGSPADRAGVREGDGIAAVDGVETAPMDLEEVITRIRGPVGTTVTLTLRREGNAEPLEIHVVREKIRS